MKLRPDRLEDGRRRMSGSHEPGNRRMQLQEEHGYWPEGQISDSGPMREPCFRVGAQAQPGMAW
jgi:hypothetical protein